MKISKTIAFVGVALICTSAIAQPARIDYSNGNNGWQDQNGEKTRQTGYNGERPYEGSVAQSRQSGARGEYDARDSRSNSRENWRDTSRRSRYNQQNHNGYYIGQTWYSGPPRQSQYNRRGFALGYQPWARGQRLGTYNRQYPQVNYRQHNLRAPPRGYHWVQDNRGDYILAAIATGIILEVILSGMNR